MAATDRFARNGAVHMRDRGPAPRFAAGALSALLLAGCATQPETKVVVVETHETGNESWRFKNRS